MHQGRPRAQRPTSADTNSTPKRRWGKTGMLWGSSTEFSRDGNRGRQRRELMLSITTTITTRHCHQRHQHRHFQLQTLPRGPPTMHPTESLANIYGILRVFLDCVAKNNFLIRCEVNWKFPVTGMILVDCLRFKRARRISRLPSQSKVAFFVSPL